MGQASLSRASDFARVRATGRRARSNGVGVIAARAVDGSGPSKLGLAVGRAAGGAVERNRIKRRLREAWRASEPPAGYEVIVRPLPDAERTDFQELVEHMKLALSRAVIQLERR